MFRVFYSDKMLESELFKKFDEAEGHALILARARPNVSVSIEEWKYSDGAYEYLGTTNIVVIRS